MKRISRLIHKKAMKIIREKRITKEIETDRRVHFLVKGNTSDHFVIYDKIKNKWYCDCKYSSLKNKECSHIYSSKIFLKK